MSTMPTKVVLSALNRLKAFVASALSFGSVRWRLMAVLLAVSLVAYGSCSMASIAINTTRS